MTRSLTGDRTRDLGYGGGGDCFSENYPHLLISS